jgi:phosphate transport system permease protein
MKELYTTKRSAGSGEAILEGVGSEALATPVRRERRARRSVILADRIADRVITIGGILVIIAVLGILVFLVAEVLPLFRGGKVTATHEYTVAGFPDRIVGMNMDEYKTAVVAIAADGRTTMFHARTGTPLESPSFDLQGKKISTAASTIDRSGIALGFEDGTVRFGEIRFQTEILSPQEAPAGLRKLDERDRTDGRAVYSTIPGNQLRKLTSELKLEEPISVSPSGRPIVAMDYRKGGEAERQSRALVAVDDDGGVTLNLTETKVNLFTGEKRAETKSVRLPPLPEDAKVQAVLLTDNADEVYVVERGGTVYRYNTSNPDAPILAETARPLSPGVELTAAGLLLGTRSLVLGGSDGSLGIFFLLDRPGAGSQDGQALVRTREFASGGAPALRVDPSLRGKGFAVVDASGAARLFHGTSQKTILSFRQETAANGSSEILLAPRFDGLFAMEGSGRARFWEFSVPHPETTWRTLFGKVWYEGYREPSYTWQSSAATEVFEPKLSLVPLIFGTIKAAFYSLLFAVPVAILGAMYTSEFLHARVRSVVKPMMEMMASLPSVVLGFVAALVLAPVVETWIAAVLLAFLAVPLGLLVAAYLWQLIPLRVSLRLQGVPKFLLMFAVIGVVVFLSAKAGPVFEALFFKGDFKAWVRGDAGGPEPLLLLLAAPVSFITVAALGTHLFGRRLGLLLRRLNRFQAALAIALRWLATVAASLLCSYLIARGLGSLGLDPRGHLVGTYVQRNTLVVGFAMGFAVIPLIYTLAEDALNSVPEHLRAASLACGATSWQTALWVVLPTALSGVFSAVMIGMGRAVGETMIVVMAAGNTPIIDWNIFNGLRALSATIAVELPEAVKDGTLYRILFLAGLVLFAMTFVINTLAEVVRQRFRKRAKQL